MTNRLGRSMRKASGRNLLNKRSLIGIYSRGKPMTGRHRAQRKKINRQSVLSKCRMPNTAGIA